MNSSLPTEGDPTDHVSISVDANPILVRKDDDGLALDDYFEAMPNSPVRRDMVDTGDEVALPRTTRIIVNQINVATGECAFFMAADPNRQSLFISVTRQEGNIQGVILVSEKTAATGFAGGGAGLVGALDTVTAPTLVQEVAAHNGAVWILNPNSPSVVTVTSVTV